MQYPMKYIENNLVWNHDGECFAYYAVLNGARALIVDPKAERGNWKHDLPEIADAINIVSLPPFCPPS